MAYVTLRVEDPDPGIRVIAFNRPEAANALSSEMAGELLEAWSRMADDAALRCVIVRGEGKHFQAGADLKERNGMTDEAWADQHRLFEAMIRAQLACPVPVIAAVHGAAMGGGTEITLASDFAYAAAGARFGLPEAGLGILPGLGGGPLLVRAVGARRAVELITSARPFSAEEAADWGLVNGVVAAADLLPHVLQIARTIASKAPLSVRGAKAIVRRSQDLELARAMEFELTVYNRLFTTHDRREGVAAFNEKRSPQFTGA